MEMTRGREPVDTTMPGVEHGVESSRRSGSPSRLLSKSLAVGVAVALLVLLAGGRYVLDRPVNWSATSSFVVFPQAGDEGSEASYYETLARGQIVSTMAQIVREQQDSAGADVVVEVIPETSVVTLIATSESRSDAEAVAARQLGRALAAVRGLGLPFEVRTVSTGAGTATTADASTTTLIGVVVFVALVLGLLVQEALAALGRRRRRAAGIR